MNVQCISCKRIGKNHLLLVQVKVSLLIMRTILLSLPMVSCPMVLRLLVPRIVVIRNFPYRWNIVVIGNQNIFWLWRLQVSLVIILPVVQVAYSI